MSGKDCTEENGNLYVVWESLDARIFKVSIGDGGNELGCGKIAASFVKSEIPRIDQILCRSSCDALILAGVSNWGAYALAFGVAPERFRDLVTVEGERCILQTLVGNGAVDPKLGSELAVDGMLFSAQHTELLNSLRNSLIE
jgi:hypothetical protein